jgi:hypothetical protein
MGASREALAQRADRLSREDALAYFIFNCGYFGIWPDAIDPQKTKVLQIGILGRNELSPSLDKVSARATATWFREGRVLIKQADRPEDLSACHIVFLSGGRDGVRTSALEVFGDKPVLLISESRDFIDNGGTIGVRIEDQTLTFEINLDRLDKLKIELDSKLLRRSAAFITGGKRELNTVTPRGGGARAP